MNNDNENLKNAMIIKNLTLFFGGFLLFTDVFFLAVGIVYDMPLIRYLIYVKLVINTTNIYLILKKHYLVSTVIIYVVIMAMMVVGIISMGTRPAFQLYALGMLICVSYNGYLHNRILKKELPFMLMMGIHVLLYTGMLLYARFREPLYTYPQSAVDILVIFNSVATFSIVILYAFLFHNVAIHSEEKLEKMALMDKLTGLYNRHYLLAFLDHTGPRNPEDRWIAMLDIDDFKKINDSYGHNCGDFILHEIAAMIRDVCKNCIVCRWGGEEFIILSNINECSTEVLETLRKNIENREFIFEGNTIHATVTIGECRYETGQSNDKYGYPWLTKSFMKANTAARTV